MVKNISRSIFLGITKANWVRLPFNTSVDAHYKRLTRLSANFALVADVALAAAPVDGLMTRPGLASPGSPSGPRRPTGLTTGETRQDPVEVCR